MHVTIFAKGVYPHFHPFSSYSPPLLSVSSSIEPNIITLFVPIQFHISSGLLYTFPFVTYIANFCHVKIICYICLLLCEKKEAKAWKTRQNESGWKKILCSIVNYVMLHLHGNIIYLFVPNRLESWKNEEFAEKWRIRGKIYEKKKSKSKTIKLIHFPRQTGFVRLFFAVKANLFTFPGQLNILSKTKWNHFSIFYSFASCIEKFPLIFYEFQAIFVSKRCRMTGKCN